MYNSIHVLRGAAALIVVIMHILYQQLWYESTYSLPPAFIAHFYNLKSLGGAGVHLFFVISGFVLAKSIARMTERRPVDFLLKRLIRVAPLYLIISVAAYWLTTDRTTADLNSLIFSVLYIPMPDLSPTVGYGWSLNYEMWFYVVTAASLCFRRSMTFSFLVCSFTVWASVLFNNFFVQFYGNPIVLEFFMGVVISKIYTSKEMKALSVPLFITGTGMMLSTAFFLTVPSVIDIKAIFGWSIPSVAMILGFTAYEHHFRRFGITPLLNLLGSASYALYLSHWIVLKLFDGAWLSLIKANASSDAVCVAMLAICVAVAVVIHYLLERPLNTGLARWLTPRQEVKVST